MQSQLSLTLDQHAKEVHEWQKRLDLQRGQSHAEEDFLKGKVEELTLEVSRAKQQLEAAKGRADEFEDKYRAMFRERQRLE